LSSHRLHHAGDDLAAVFIFSSAAPRWHQVETEELEDQLEDQAMAPLFVFGGAPAR